MVVSNRHQGSADHGRHRGDTLLPPRRRLAVGHLPDVDAGGRIDLVGHSTRQQRHRRDDQHRFDRQRCVTSQSTSLTRRISSRHVPLPS